MVLPSFLVNISHLFVDMYTFSATSLQLGGGFVYVRVNVGYINVVFLEKIYNFAYLNIRLYFIA